MGDETKEFMFIDESGDPGFPGETPRYILMGAYLKEPVLPQLRKHLTSFRYHNNVTREFKDQGWAKKFTPTTRRLLAYTADLADEGYLVVTTNWLDKATYQANSGPYTSHAMRFRPFQLRLLLERHIQRQAWGDNLDLVIDRWRMNLDQQRDLEDYLRGNWELRPVIRYITLVDSSYTGMTQLVDIFGRLVSRVLSGKATDEEEALCQRLMSLKELKGGLYA